MRTARDGCGGAATRAVCSHAPEPWPASPAVGSSTGRHLYVRWWLGSGLVIIAASVLFLSAPGQAREHPRFPGSSAVGVLLPRGPRRLYHDELAPIGEWRFAGQVFPVG
jgi:hypothetical protein